MSWEMQILLPVLKKGKWVKEWASVGPTHSGPYRYPTQRQAQNSLDSCYGRAVVDEELRTIEVNEPSNIGLER